MVSDLDTYLFDLRGYLILEGALTDAEVSELNGYLDAIPAMQPADALLFVDGVSHGSAKRVNEGQRRIDVYRYGPSWGTFRMGYKPSPELLERLTPQRRQIVQPLELLPREPQKTGP